MKTSIQGLVAVLALLTAAIFTTGCKTTDGASAKGGDMAPPCSASDKQAGLC